MSGLCQGVCYAELGNQVICVDKDQPKLETLQKERHPDIRTRSARLSLKNMAAGKLSLHVRFESGGSTVGHRDSSRSGHLLWQTARANLSYIDQAAAEIAEAMNGYKIIAVKSTVPVGTNERVRNRIRKLTVTVRQHFAAGVSGGRLGSAGYASSGPDRHWSRFLKCRRHDDQAACFIDGYIVVTDIRSSEMLKYASNAFLATKISFINEIANICEKVGADVTQVAKGMGYDKRIGRFVSESRDWLRGLLFPKDTRALIQIAGHVETRVQIASCGS